MTIKHALRFAAILALAVAAIGVAPASADERDDLKKRFAERYPTLVELKNKGLVGETFEGLAEVVKPEYGARRIEPNGKDRRTVAAFLADENRDRRRLYELLAAETNTKPDVVARRNARRNFDKAGPNEFLKPKPNVWVRKKDL